MKEIKLTNSELSAQVDDDIYEVLSKYNWGINTNGYARLTVDPRTKMHRFIFNHLNIDILGKEIDHIDRNKLNNTISNIRVCTHGENVKNIGKPRHGITSIYKGVSWCSRSNKWYAQIRINKRSTFIGYYLIEMDAARAYNAAATIHHGDFASLNVL